MMEGNSWAVFISLISGASMLIGFILIWIKLGRLAGKYEEKFLAVGETVKKIHADFEAHKNQSHAAEQEILIFRVEFKKDFEYMKKDLKEVKDKLDRLNNQKDAKTNA